MSSKDFKIYLEDMLEAIERIQKYVSNKSKEEFIKDELLIDATIKNIMIVGEAAKKVPQEFKKEHSEIEWRKIAGTRDILIHSYFNIDLDILWDIVENKLPELKEKLKKILEN